jgi:hypothetical protein
MTKRLTRLVTPMLVLVAALALTAGPALAHDGGRGAKGAVGKQALATAAATYIGATQAEITAARTAGQTLAQLATSKGKTVQGLTDALVAAGNTSIDAALAAGTITAAQATARKAALSAQVTALINATGGPCASGPGKGAAKGSAKSSKSASLKRR